MSVRNPKDSQRVHEISLTGELLAVYNGKAAIMSHKLRKPR